MRLLHVVLLALAALAASTSAAPASADISKLTGEPNKRFLRAEQAVVNSDTEGERRLTNVDLIIKDAMVSVKKATKWKAQFVGWKLMGKTPEKLAQELKIMNRGHPKWKKLMAYQKYYGKGPLRYP